MDLNHYCEYARNNNIKCSYSDLMVECNKHFIIKVIHHEIPSGRCATFDENYDSKQIKITLVNRVSLISEALVLVDLKCLYDPHLIERSTYKNTFAYLMFKN